MLIIRKEQMTNFQKDRVKQRLSKLLKKVRNEAPDFCDDLTDEKARQEIRNSLLRARRNGFYNPKAKELFVILEALLGKGFMDKGYPESTIEQLVNSPLCSIDETYKHLLKKES